MAEKSSSNRNKEETNKKKKTTTTTKKKDEAAAAAVVLRMELHCDGCALKVRKAIKGAQGAESVRTDVAAGTVTVAGKPDPWDLKDRIVQATRLDVAFVSPPNPPRQHKQQGNNNKNKKQGNAADANNIVSSSSCKKQKQPPQSPPESTVVLSIQLHCEGCIDRIKRKANKIKGVKQVTVDTAKEQVTVKGTMDAKSLPDVLRTKLKREVTAVAVPMTNKEKKAADSGGDNHAEREEVEEAAAAISSSNATSGASKKKNENNRKKQQQATAAAGDDHKEMAWTSLEEQQCAMIFPPSYGPVGSSSSYRAELLQGPQLFSDENPNACSLM